MQPFAQKAADRRNSEIAIDHVFERKMGNPWRESRNDRREYMLGNEVICFTLIPMNGFNRDWAGRWHVHISYRSARYEQANSADEISGEINDAPNESSRKAAMNCSAMSTENHLCVHVTLLYHMKPVMHINVMDGMPDERTTEIMTGRRPFAFHKGCLIESDEQAISRMNSSDKSDCSNSFLIHCLQTLDCRS
jgi:hypothetical protein